MLGETNIIGGMAFSNGTLNLTSSGVIELDIADAGNYDRLYAGNIVFGGTCSVSMANGHVPMQTETYKLFDFENNSDAFATVNLPEFRGVIWDTNSLYTTGELTAIRHAGTMIRVY